VLGGTSYQFQLKKGTTVVYTKTVSSSACGTSTCSSTPATILGYAAYKWRLRAKVGGVWGAWSSYKSFRVRKAGFNSSFNSNINGWKTVNGTWSIFNSSYLRTYGLLGTYVSTYYNYDWKKLNYTVKMKRDGCLDCGNALYIRGTPAPTNGAWQSGYWFGYRNDGHFGVWERNGGTWHTLKNWTSSAAIDRVGWNTLKVIADGTKLKFYINGTLVWTGSDSSLANGKVGITMYRNASAGNRLLVDWAKLTANFSMPAAAIEEVEPGQVELPGVRPDMGPDPAP